MPGSDDLVARLDKKAIELLEHRHATAGWLMQEASAALASRDKEIERLAKERDAQKRRGDNHAETLRGVRKWIRENDIDRALLWISDGLSGYTEPAEKTLCEAIARAEAAEALAATATRERDEARAEVERKDAALRRADQFITNGIELGFIRMPDASTPDPAHETPGIIRAALAKGGENGDA